MLFRKWFKKSCLLCGNFISIHIINRALHGRLGIRILSSRTQSIPHSFAALTRERYFQHSKIKFVSPRGHVLCSIYTIYIFFNSFNLIFLCLFNSIALYPFNLIGINTFNSIHHNIHLILGTGSSHGIRKIRAWERIVADEEGFDVGRDLQVFLA